MHQFTPFCTEFHAVTKSFQMHPNTIKRTKTWVQGPMGWIWSFIVKITMWIRGTNLCINCTISVCFATSFLQLRNDPKCTQTQWNTPRHEFRVQWGGWGALVAKKLQRDFMARTFALIEPVQYVLLQVSCSYGTIPNAPKYYKTDRNISLGSNGVDWCIVAKNPDVTSWHELLH